MDVRHESKYSRSPCCKAEIKVVKRGKNKVGYACEKCGFNLDGLMMRLKKLKESLHRPLGEDGRFIPKK